MANNEVVLTLRAKDDASKVIAKTVATYDELNEQIARFIKNERANIIAENARKAFEGMTDAEKETYLATYELEKAEKAAEAEARKLADAQRKLDEENQKNKNSLKGLVNGLADLKAGYDLVSGAASAIINAGKELVEGYEAQSQAVKEFAQFTGQSYEETSRLIQVTDRAGVTLEAVKAAFQAMTTKGIAPSIESLAELSDEYRQISDENEKAQFLVKNFGNEGAKLGQIFAMTGDQIREAGAAVDESLIFDDEKIAKAEQLRVSMDNLGDSVQALKNNAIEPLIPALTTWFNLMAASDSKLNPAARYVDTLANSVIFWIDALRQATGTQKESIKETDAQTNTIEAATDATNEQTEALRTAIRWMQQGADVTDRYNALSTANATILDKQTEAEARLIAQRKKEEAATRAAEKAQRAVNAAISGTFRNAYRDYVNTISDLSDEHERLTEEKEKLIRWGYSPEGAKVKALDEALAANAQAQEDAAAAAAKHTKELLYQQVAASLDSTAALELARAWGLVSETDYNVAIATQELTEAFDTNKDGVLTATEATGGFYEAMENLNEALADGTLTAEELKEILDALESKDITVNVHTNYTSSGTPPPVNYSGEDRGKGRASGGAVAGNTPYLVGEQGPEIFVPNVNGTIMNNRQTEQALSGGGGGNTWNVSINVNGAGDPAAVARAVRSELAKMAERERSSGLTRNRR